MRILSRANLYSAQCLAQLTQTACLFFYHEQGDCARAAEALVIAPTKSHGVTANNTVTLTFMALTNATLFRIIIIIIIIIIILVITCMQDIYN
jgi:hypothetical protein